MPTPAPLLLSSERAGAIDHASSILREGGVVVLPTETVYGLAARLDAPDAVARVFAIKGRPPDRPLSVLVDAYARTAALWLPGPWCAAAEALANAFWPGPLTIVAPAQTHIDRRVLGGLATVGLRCPDHAFTRSVIARAGGAVAAPSANPTDTPSPTTAAVVLATLGGSVDAIVDGGACRGGVESTIITLDADGWRIVRHGAIAVEALRPHLSGILPEYAEHASASRPTPHTAFSAQGAALALYVPTANADVSAPQWARLQVLETPSTDALFQQLHAFLGELDAATRAQARWQLSAVALADPRLPALITVLERYLAGEHSGIDAR